MAWKYYGVCECGFKSEAHFKSLHHIHIDCCPNCGIDKNEWSLRKMRYVSDAKLLNPLTWFDGHWETNESSYIED